jgi:penicillin-binding protein 2
MRKDDQALIKSYLTDQRSVMMDRAYQGAYAPGSIVKPYMAIAALQEGVVTPEWGIVSTGSISIPNPYNPAKPFIFRDWKAHGFVDMRRAIGVSSDVYFYAVGGGYGGQRGMGIAAIEKWGKAFGFGQETGFDLPGEAEGQIPSPEWKAQTFPKDTRWTIGNTYHASIGQYGWLATPMQAVRYTAAVANYGTLWQPHLIQGEDPVGTPVGADKKNIEVAHDGMRNSATYGTAKSLNIPGFDLAGKTGTAEVGAHNEKMHSWVIGFWPSHHPKFAFVTMYENGKAGTMVGAAPSMRPFFEQLLAEHSPYMRGEYPSQDSRKPQEQEAAALDDASSGAPTTQDVVTPSDLESPANTAPLEVPTIAPPAPAQATPSQGAISAPTTIAPLSVPETPGAATSQ